MQVDRSKTGRPVGLIVLVGVRPGQLPEVARQLAEVEQVNDVLEVHGEYEILLRLYCNDTETLRSILTEKIRKLPGVKATTVLYIFKNWKET